MNEVTFQATIIKQLTKLCEDLEAKSPDTKSNTGRRLGKAFMLGVIASYTDKQYAMEMKALTEDKVLDSKEGLDAGDWILGESPKFVVTCKVSEPRKSFDADGLASALKKKYKIPEAITKDFVEKTKKEGAGNKTVKIIERG